MLIGPVTPDDWDPDEAYIREWWLAQQELEEHLAGKHDQRSHGKKGVGAETGGGKAGGGLPDAPNEAGVRAAESLIAHNDHESLFVFDHEGQLIHEEVGGAHSVAMDPTVTSAGDLHLHNHPSDRPFSPPDVENGFALEAGEIRVVGRTTRARLLPPEGQDYFDSTQVGAFHQSFTNNFNRLGLSWGGEPSAGQADAVWRGVAQDMGLRYSYGPR